MTEALYFAGIVPVGNLVDYVEEGSSLDNWLEDFPSIRPEKAIAVLQSAMERHYADAIAA
jgi:uncharacterized protein (DUF433 family)